MNDFRYFSVTVTLKFESKHALEALLFPIKTIGYAPCFDGVTLVERIQKDMYLRLKQCKIDEINVFPMPQHELEAKFMVKAATFKVYDFTNTLSLLAKIVV